MKRLSEEHKKNISKALKGRTPANLDMAQQKAWKRLRTLKGNKSPQWKGADVGYQGIHAWMRKVLGQPNKCSSCGKAGLEGRSIHWANISGEYRRDPDDWMRLCVSCHWKHDKPYLQRNRGVDGRFK